MEMNPGSLDASTQGLAATCGSCGAPQPISLFARTRPCSYCRAPDPLPPALRARAAQAAELVRKQVKQHRLPEELVASAGELGWMAVALVGGSYLVGAGLALVTVASALPPGVGVWSFLIAGQAKSLDAFDTRLYWWLLYSLLVLISACPAWVWGGQLRVYAAIGRLRALPPLRPGGSARCHLCGDSLPPEGVIRRCRSCQCDNLVAGARYRSESDSFERALAETERAARDEVGVHVGRIEKGIMWIAGGPFLLLLLAPLAALLDDTRPDLLGIPLVLIGLGLALRLVGALVRPRAASR
jgi:hypothetical protein